MQDQKQVTLKSLTPVYQLHAQQMGPVRHQLLAAAPDL